MENKFECGNEVFLRAAVCAIHEEYSPYDYDVWYLDHDTGEKRHISVIEEQLTTAGETADDLASKLHEAEAEIEKLNAKLETLHDLVRKKGSALSDYRYLFKHRPELIEFILHEMCESWRAVAE